MSSTPNPENLGRDYSRKEVVSIIQSVLGTIDKDNDVTAKLHAELSTLGSYIESMREELAELRSIEISHNHIPAASDELDAVVDETAKATGAIMDSCDLISNIAGGIEGAKSDELNNAVTAIYEACSFQDITGQRITKVVRTLKHIEVKVADIIEAFGQISPVAAENISEEEEAKLLNGPQLSGSAPSQDDIDKLLASFD